MPEILEWLAKFLCFSNWPVQKLKLNCLIEVWLWLPLKSAVGIIEQILHHNWTGYKESQLKCLGLPLESNRRSPINNLRIVKILIYEISDDREWVFGFMFPVLGLTRIWQCGRLSLNGFLSNGSFSIFVLKANMEEYGFKTTLRKEPSSGLYLFSWSLVWEYYPLSQSIILWGRQNITHSFVLDSKARKLFTNPTKRLPFQFPT